MLGQALRNLSLGGTTPQCLPRLYLEADYRCRDTRQDLSGEEKSQRLSFDRDDLAARSFHFTVEALVLSGLKTRRLNIYYGEASDEPCAYVKNGLYSAELIGIEARYPGLRACLASTASLSIGSCPPRSRRCPEDGSGIRSSLSSQEAKPGLNVQNVRDSPDLGHLLQLTEDLCDFGLQYSTRCWGRRYQDRMADREHQTQLLRSLATSRVLPRLGMCRLRGLHCTPNDLVLYLQRTRPCHIMLHGITVVNGTWQRVFEHITGPQTGIEGFFLQKLLDERSTGRGHVSLWFPEARVNHRFRAESEIGSGILTRETNNVRCPLYYRYMGLEEYDDLEVRANSRTHKLRCVADICSTCQRYDLKIAAMPGFGR